MRSGWKISGGIVIGVVGMSFWRYPPQSSQDWATWVSAIFTGVAFGGTIYIATLETIRRKRENEARAVLAAARIQKKFSSVLGIAKAVRKNLQEGVEKQAITSDFFAANLAKLKTVRLWSYEDLIALVPIEGDISVQLARAEDEIGAVIDMLEKGIESFQRFQASYWQDPVKLMCSILSDAIRRTENVVPICTALLPKDSSIKAE